jgi:hypothetical protein
LPYFHVEGNTRDYEKKTFLGIFFSLSVFYEDDKTIAEHYFSNSMNLNLNQVNATLKTLRLILYEYQHLLYEISWLLLKSGTEVKELFLQEIAHILSINSKRTQLQVNTEEISSDGFINNLCHVLLHLSEPFIREDSSQKVRFFF